MDISRYAPNASIEEKKAATILVNVIATETVIPLLKIEDFSSVNKLFRTTAWVIATFLVT